MLLVLASVAITAAADNAASYKGLEMAATSVARATRVSLQDCPPGENIVRGVIRPMEEMEFATITIDVNAGGFEGGEVPKPLLYDADGIEYKTAQSFRDAGSEESYTCTFAFRVPKGVKVSRVAIDDVSLDLASLEK
jgi:hypothetical protein